MHQLLSSCAAACVSAALGATPSAASAAQTSFPRLLNDTGSVTCYVPDRGGTEIPCEGTGQDGQYGRDVTDWRKFDGRGGFSYRKISSTGEPLPASATEWACVQDRVTGLMWEMKTADGGLHDGLRTYTQLNNGDSDDVSGFVREANQAGLCGHHDWRLPARMELQSIIDLGHHAPLVVDGWFPNTPASYFWASTKSADDAAYWSAGFKQLERGAPGARQEIPAWGAWGGPLRHRWRQGDRHEHGPGVAPLPRGNGLGRRDLRRRSTAGQVEGGAGPGPRGPLRRRVMALAQCHGAVQHRR
jgi:hypothetical protein